MSLNRGVTQGYILTAKKSPQKDTQQPSITAQAILRLYSQLGSWGKVAEALGVTRSLVWKEAHGRIHSPTGARALRVYRDQKRIAQSMDPKFLRLIRQVALPWLRKREKANVDRQEIHHEVSSTMGSAVL